MATEIVEQREVHGLEAFNGYDQSIFFQWLEGLTDLMMAGNDPSMLGRHTLSTVGGLMNVLTLAAKELGERERQELREGKA